MPRYHWIILKVYRCVDIISVIVVLFQCVQVIKCSPVWYISAVARRLNRQTQCTVVASSVISPLCRWLLIKQRNVDYWVKGNIMSFLGKYWFILWKENQKIVLLVRDGRVCCCIVLQLVFVRLSLLVSLCLFCPSALLGTTQGTSLATGGLCLLLHQGNLFWLYFAFQGKSCLNGKTDWQLISFWNWYLICKGVKSGVDDRHHASVFSLFPGAFLRRQSVPLRMADWEYF